MGRRWRSVCAAFGAGIVLAAGAHAAGAAPGQIPVEDLGSPLASVLVHEGGIGPGPDGRLLAYAVLQGDNSALNVVDALTGERVDVVPLPGATGGWGITVTDDGDVYLGTYYNGHLYRYDPATAGEVADLGQPVEGDGYLWGLTHGPDGTIYGGTYPSASAFAYHPDDDTVTNFGQFSAPNSPYVRSSTFDPDTGTLFIGTGMGDARLFAIDVASGTNREIAMPDDWDGKAFVDLRYADGKVLANVDSALVIFDVATGERLPLIDGETGEQVPSTSLISRGVSEAIDGAVFYSDVAGSLMRLDLATLTFSRPPMQPDAPKLPGAAIGFGLLPDGSGLVSWSGNYSGKAVRYDIAAEQLSVINYDVQPVPPHMGHVVAAPDQDLIYLSAGQQGDFGVFDPATGTATKGPRYGQVEGWLWQDGLLYSGTYPNGNIQVWDPKTPDTAPRVLASLEADHHQNRPMTLTSDGASLFVGTTPGYAEFGGAITVLDLATEDYQVHRNVIPDHSISALLADGDHVIGGSSVDGGTGTDPRDGEAHLFLFDPATAEVTADVVPVPGARSINALIKTSRGHYWGLADGTAFRFDPNSLEVRRSVELYDVTLESGALDGELIEHPNGQVYASSRQQVYAFDPVRVGPRHQPTLVAEGVHRLTLSPSGSLYGLGQPAGGSGAYTQLLRITPPS